MAGDGGLRPGVRVRTAGGTELGVVAEVRDATAVVEQGPALFRRRREIPLDALGAVRDGEAWLARDRWDDGDRWDDRDDGAAREELRELERGEGTFTVPVVEEEVSTGTRLREAGAVRIRKRVVTVERQITVPVLREEIVVERLRGRPPARLSSPAGAPFEESSVTIPLYEEEVEIVKRPRVREVVRVEKVVRHERRTLGVDVRRAEVRVEGTGAAAGVGAGGDPTVH